MEIHRMKRPATLFSGLALAALMVLAAPSSSTAQMIIARSVIGSGGNIGASGGGFSMASTIGQPVIGPVAGGGLNLHQGFWFTLPQGVGSVDYPSTGAVAGTVRNWPNPFSASTTIFYTLATKSNVKVVVYSASGEVVRSLFSGPQESGEQNVLWDGIDNNGDRASAGMYIYTIEAPGARNEQGFSARGKMLIVR